MPAFRIRNTALAFAATAAFAAGIALAGPAAADPESARVFETGGGDFLTIAVLCAGITSPDDLTDEEIEGFEELNDVEVVLRTDRADRISTGSGDQFVVAGAGNDTISTGSGNDYVCGGAGNDTISLGSHDDEAEGGAGNDTISGGTDDDRLAGNAGKDTLTGGSDGDLLDGGAEKDSCSGGSGDNDLVNC